MSVVSIFGRDAEAEARALQKVAAQAPQAMSESDRLLHNILEGGDVIGRDDSGRVVMLLAIDPRDFRQLETFGADAVECEDGGDDEPYECLPVQVCWFRDGGAPYFRRATGPVLDLLPPNWLGRVVEIAQAVALALLLVIVPQLEVRADPAPAMTPLPATAQAPQTACASNCVLKSRQS